MATTTEWLAGIGIGAIIGIAFSQKIRYVLPGIFPAATQEYRNEWDSAINVGYKEQPMWQER